MQVRALCAELGQEGWGRLSAECPQRLRSRGVQARRPRRSTRPCRSPTGRRSGSAAGPADRCGDPAVLADWWSHAPTPR
jgi:hypothetical protein